MSSIEKADQQRGIQLNRKSHIDKIRDYLLDKTGKIELTAAEDRAYQRLQKAWSMKLKGYSQDQIAQAIAKEFGITARQGNYDVMAAISLYGDTSRASKEGMRALLSEMAMRVFKIASAQEDLKGMDAALGRLIKIHGIDKEDPETIDFSKLEQHVYATVLDDESQRALKLLIDGKGAINLSQALDKLHANAKAVDVDAEEVNDAD